MRRRSQNLISLLLLSLLVVGCSSPSGMGETASAPASMPNRSAGAEMADMKLAAEPAAPGSAQAYLVNETQVADRWLVRNGALTLEVPDIPKARQEAIRILRAAGGYIENESMSGEPLRMGSMTARVPVQKYEDTMEKLKAGTRVLAESTNTDDVTTQAVDAQARLKVLRAEEQSLLSLYSRARNVDEILKLRSQLSSIRQEIESVDAQLKNLARMSALSTITINYQIPVNLPPAAPGDWAGRAFQEAYAGLLGFVRGLADFGIRFLVFVPIWGPIVGLFWWLVRRAKKHEANAAQ